MWGVLLFNSDVNQQSSPSNGLLHPSLVPTGNGKNADKAPGSALEIKVAVAPEVTLDPAPTGVHNAGLPPYIAVKSLREASPDGFGTGDVLVAPPASSLMFNTPWLWTDKSQFADVDSSVCLGSESAVGNVDGFSAWWDFGNF